MFDMCNAQDPMASREELVRPGQTDLQAPEALAITVLLREHRPVIEHRLFIHEYILFPKSFESDVRVKRSNGVIIES